MKKPPQRRHGKTPAARPSLLERINPNAAGIDCGAARHYVAVPPDRDPTPVPGAAAYDAHTRERVLRRLRQRAAHLGYVLLNRETGELLEGAVS